MMMDTILCSLLPASVLAVTRPEQRCLIRTSAADTSGAFSVVEIISQPGDGTPIHVHRNEDEHFIILEGTARILYGDKIFDAPAGTSISASKNIPHAWCNPFDTPFRMLVVASPGCEEALRVKAKRSHSDMPALAASHLDMVALAASLNIVILGPPLLELDKADVVAHERGGSSI
jgi:mannose-6-phosphate isomerase-like protein (cupin superfamily)